MAVHEYVDGGRQQRLTLRGQQRCRHERRLSREVGTELDAAEARRLTPGARAADRIADSQCFESLWKVARPGRVETHHRRVRTRALAQRRTGEHTKRSECAGLDDCADARLATDLLRVEVVVDEPARRVGVTSGIDIESTGVRVATNADAGNVMRTLCVRSSDTTSAPIAPSIR